MLKIHKKTASFALLASLLLSAVVSACGGAQPEPLAPTAPPAVSVPPRAEGVPLGPSSTPPGPSAQAAFEGPMKPIVPSAMAGDLQAMGLDLKALPPLNKLDPATLRKVMRTFTKALGGRCGDCHNDADYGLPTPMKKIAEHMWNDFARGLAMENGSPLYCDSCHQGRMKTLDRHDKKALGQWMDKNFVDRLKRADGKEHNCETCHGDPFDGVILAKWSGKG